MTHEVIRSGPQLNHRYSVSPRSSSSRTTFRTNSSFCLLITNVALSV